MEFVGTTVESLNMEERMTLCNMVVEAGGKNGVVPADSATFKCLETSVAYEPVYSDKQASFLTEYRFDVSKLEPLVAKPRSADNRALARECKDVNIDRVYIGSCTGGKTEDFLAAANVFLASGRKVKVPTFLVPATQKVWMDLYTLRVPGSGGKTCSQIFEEAGCDTLASPTCGACMGGPKDTYARVCVSTTNRNFPGRMGHKEGQIYLASPYTAAASALTDTIVFEYNNQFHNVKQVTDQDFQSCNATSAIAVYTTGSDSITLKTPGHYYFLCGFPGHCEAGQKLDIMVAPGSLSPSPRPSAGSSSHNSPHPDDQIQRNSASSLQILSFKLWLALVSIAIFVVVEEAEDKDRQFFNIILATTYEKHTEQCHLLDTVSCSSQQLCNYTYGYGGSQLTKGVLATEKITFGSTSGNPTVLDDIVFGCGHNNTGGFNENEMGLVGLGGRNLSLTSQICSRLGTNKFSYCSVPFRTNPNITSKIHFGSGSEVSGDDVVSTPIVPKDDPTYHFVTLEGISVGNKFIQQARSIPPPLDGVLCFSMLPVDADVGIYGNFAQSNYFIGYDLDKQIVSFKPADCTKQ
ncbi:3-isopropylmalate dehydratase large subunit-like [Melia azedarach]|uniref:3-isopropylmalate dehydratase large subunit-like n=1 Tax=Melia azedarach TaxID=155640 RepID=A0ACC1YGZ3_MELAZ|nr:3-isopropylmalate dehydratase large subunit-like [Melia azedarach]